MEKSKLKKIFLVIGFLLVVFIMGYLLWITFFKKAPSSDLGSLPLDERPGGQGLPLSPDGSGQIIGDEDPDYFLDDDEYPDPDRQYVPLPPSSEEPFSPVAIGGLTVTNTIVPHKTMDPTLNRDGSSLQFYNRDDGKFYISNDQGDLILLSNKVFHNVEKVNWAPNKTKAVLEYPDGNKIVYDFSTERQVTLPKHWEDFSFSSDSNKLVNKSLGLDPDNRWLIVSNSDGSQSRPLELIGNNDTYVIPSWSPNNQSVAMYTKGVDFDRREVFFVGLNKENFKSTIIEGWGFQPLWSNKGDKLLYSVYSPKDNLRPKLWSVSAQGDEIGVSRRDLGVFTWADKCSFANDYEVYCAVPRSLPEGSGLYPEIASDISNDIYKININTGQKELIAIPSSSYDISSIMISSDNKNLFFSDRQSGEIHKIKLQ